MLERAVALVKGYPEQAKLLEAVIESDCFTADELPAFPVEMRKPPKPKPTDGDLLDFVDG